MENNETTFDHVATYSPEDDKIRIYFGYRVDKEIWERFKKAGFTWTMKQESDLAAVWTTYREDIALEFCGELLDHDLDTRLDRAADRAERFSGYRDKREGDAIGAAPQAETTIGMQSERKAAILARRVERAIKREETNWNKAEYWQTRTAGVISHALYKENAGVRYRRIKTIEADFRKYAKTLQETADKYNMVRKALEGEDEKMAQYCIDSFWLYTTEKDSNNELLSLYSYQQKHNCSALETLKVVRSNEDSNTAHYTRWKNHAELRIAYERQMLAEQGFTAHTIEYKKGGTLVYKCRGDKVEKTGIITKINKGAAGVNTLEVDGKYKISITSVISYADPTEESTAKVAEAKEANKQPPLINPTKEAADAISHENKAEEMTADEYKNKHFCSKGIYQVYADGFVSNYTAWKEHGAIIARVRGYETGSCCGNGRKFTAIILTDKPQKKLPEFSKPEKAETTEAIKEVANSI